ncbi:MAG: stage II sporulation protein R [Oscillospiraceae bacterium]|jgi:stage II sporulation protein R|nr:stage II sporulation protein R [Oscillospiraceae bacterium]
MSGGIHTAKNGKNRALRGIAALAAGTFFWSLLSFQATCAGIRREVLRLHVIANSDSDEDQSAKLAVRDAILTEGADIFDGSVTANDAEARLAPQLDRLAETARQTLASRGLDYPVEVTVGVEYFNTRSYEDVTLPAGRYHAVRVILGAGEGRNWWCVMFPPLCLPAASPRGTDSPLDAVFTGQQVKLVKSNPQYEVRFKIVELWESFWEHLRQKTATDPGVS